MKRILLTTLCLLFANTAYSQCYLQQSTAAQTIGIGPFLNSSDGNTEMTALTILNTDVRLKKGGAAWVAKNSGGGTATEHGWYDITLDATDTSTSGLLEISIHVATALAVWRTCWVEPSAVHANYNTLFQNGGNATVRVLDNVGTNSLNKNVGSQTIGIVFYDTASNGVKTGLGGTFTCNLSKDLAAYAGSTGAKAEIGNGLYTLALAQAETNVNLLSVYCTGTNARPYTAFYVTNH